FRPHQPFAGAPCWAHFCGPAWLTTLVLETGIGRANVERALDWMAGRPTLDKVPYEPRLVIFAGFAGALTPEFPVGAILFADEIIDAADHCWVPTWPTEWPPGPWTPPLAHGRLLTLDHLVSTP